MKYVWFLQDIFVQNIDVKWDDIIGLEHAKRLSKEAVVYPIKVSVQSTQYLLKDNYQIQESYSFLGVS